MNCKLIALLLAILFLLTACGDGTAELPGANHVDCIGHIDEDDNGRCDLCRSSVLEVVDFYAINDLHGKFADAVNQIGVDELTTFLRQSANEDDHSVFLSSGDSWQGSSESNLTEGLILTDWMNRMDFVSMTLGNHEFDWGEASIAKNAEAAGFPLLAINVYDKETDRRVDYADASLLIERGDAQIGIIGAIGDCYSSISGDKVTDVYFKVGAELTALVKEEADRLRKAGADFIVYSIHDGHGSSSAGRGEISDNALSGYYDVALSQGYVDLVFEAHTHQSYVLTDRHGVYHLQGGGENRGISHVEVSVNFAGGTSEVEIAEVVSANRYQNMEDDPLIAELLNKYDHLIGEASKVVGINPSYLASGQIKQLVADLYLEAGLAHWGDEYDIVIGGGFISVRSPYNLKPGEVTYSTLQMLLPFDNQLLLCSIKGRDLERRFLNTDNDNYYIAYSQSGEDLSDELDPNADYYIITDSYCAQYAPNRLTVVAEYDVGVYARDLVADWLSKQ